MSKPNSSKNNSFLLHIYLINSTSLAEILGLHTVNMTTARRHRRPIVIGHIVEIVIVQLYATLRRTGPTKVPPPGLIIGSRLMRLWLPCRLPIMGHRGPAELKFWWIVEVFAVVVETKELIAGITKETARETGGLVCGAIVGIEERAAPQFIGAQ